MRSMVLSGAPPTSWCTSSTGDVAVYGTPFGVVPGPRPPGPSSLVSISGGSGVGSSTVGSVVRTICCIGSCEDVSSVVTHLTLSVSGASTSGTVGKCSDSPYSPPGLVPVADGLMSSGTPRALGPSSTVTVSTH